MNIKIKINIKNKMKMIRKIPIKNQKTTKNPIKK
jgi:hypothetical protein